MKSRQSLPLLAHKCNYFCCLTERCLVPFPFKHERIDMLCAKCLSIQDHVLTYNGLMAVLQFNFMHAT